MIIALFFNSSSTKISSFFVGVLNAGRGEKSCLRSGGERDILMKGFHGEGERKMGRGMMKEYGKERQGMRGEEMFGKRMRKEVT